MAFRSATKTAKGTSAQFSLCASETLRQKFYEEEFDKRISTGHDRGTAHRRALEAGKRARRRFLEEHAPKESDR